MMSLLKMDVLYGIRRPFVYIYTKLCEFIAWFKPSEPPKKTLMKVLKVKKRARDQSEMYPAYYENHLRNSWNGSETIYLD